MVNNFVPVSKILKESLKYPMKNASKFWFLYLNRTSQDRGVDIVLLPNQYDSNQRKFNALLMEWLN